MSNLAEKKKRIIDKIRKLLRLSRSSNEHEAAAAAAKAQELLSEYNLSLDSMITEESASEASSTHRDIEDAASLEPVQCLCHRH